LFLQPRHSTLTGPYERVYAMTTGLTVSETLEFSSSSRLDQLRILNNFISNGH